MTILDCFKSLSRRILAQDQASLYSGMDATQFKVQEIANEAALDIAQAYDWLELTRMDTIAADGQAMAFDLPADYGRMLVKGDVHSYLWFRDYQRARDMDEWMRIINFKPSAVPGWWTLYGGQIHFWPPPPADAQPRFGYISNQIVRAQDGTLKTAFSTDSDAFVLDEQLLLLAMIWRYKQAEGLDYQEDMQNYEIRLSQLAAKDKGSRPIRSTRRSVANLGIWAIAR